MEEFRRLKDYKKKGRCPKCKKETSLVISLPSTLPGWDPEKEWTNFEAKPIKFKSRLEMTRYCKQRKLASAGLL